MSILSELTKLLSKIHIPVETGVFSDTAPQEYVVLTPLSDVLDVYADNQPNFEIQSARLSIFSQKNYLGLKNKITKALIKSEFTITGRFYVGHEDDTGYHHYSIDVERNYTWEY